MNTEIVIDCIYIIGFSILAFAPFDKKRIRAPWAKLVFAISSIIGITKGVVGLMWEMSWFTLGKEASYRLDSLFHMVGGLLLGFLFSLIFSGQLSGVKRVEQEIRHEPAA
jgi:hypothetical protein